MKEVDYYPEMADCLQRQLRSNLKELNSGISVYVGMGELRAGLQSVVRENGLCIQALQQFVDTMPPLSVDIFALLTDGNVFQLLIVEVKLLKTIGLQQLSQLIGYCIVSKAHFGLLVNVDGDWSERLDHLLMNDGDLSRIRRVLADKREVEHDFGMMIWDSATRQFRYSVRGLITDFPQLCQKISECFPPGNSSSQGHHAWSGS